MSTLSKVDCLFINHKDMIGAWPYIRTCYIAGELQKQGVCCKIIDPTVDQLTPEQILGSISHHDPAVLCISVFPSNLPDAYELINAVKRQFPHIVLVAEGYMINADPNAVLELGIKYGFRGDIEFSFAKFCLSVINKQNPDTTLEGMVRVENGVVYTNEYAVIKNLDQLSFPAFELLPIGKYYSASTNKKSMSLNVSRGCPYSCNFCANPSQLVYRYFSTQTVIEQIQHLIREHQVEHIEFLDLIFTVNKRNTKALCQAIIDNELQFDWGCQTRVDQVDAELLQIMRKAGCKKIAFGVESGSEKIRAATGKFISDEKLLSTFDICREIGIQCMAYFVMGHPGETLTDLQSTIDFSKKLDPFNAVFIRMIPLPDIDVFNVGIEEEAYPKDVWYKYMRGQTPHPRYVPATMSADDLDRMYRKAFLSFYIRWKTIINYLPLFINPLFLIRTVRFFIKMVFGSVKFSYC